MPYVVLTQENYDHLRGELWDLYVVDDGERGPFECEHGNETLKCQVVCPKCGHPCRDHVPYGPWDDEKDLPSKRVCCAKGCTCGADQVEDTEPYVVGGSGPYFVAFQAMGRYRVRVGRELVDGRKAYLQTGGGDIHAKDYARGMLTWRRLRYAVRAAREWKEKANTFRASWPASLFLGGAAITGLVAHAFYKDKKGSGS
jgi:hypothetical protein